MTELTTALSELNDLLKDFSRKAATEQMLLDGLTGFCVKSLGAAFARIWLIDESKTTLVLHSSQGMYTRLDGSRSRISIGQGSKIDVMYTECDPHITNDVQTDPAVIDKAWAQREGLVSFAGYPMCWGDEKLGVVGMYSRQILSDEMLLVLGNFSLMSSMLIYQQNQSELDKNKFCEVSGIERRLLDQMIRLG